MYLLLKWINFMKRHIETIQNNGGKAKSDDIYDMWRNK